MENIIETFEEYRETISTFNSSIWENNVPNSVLTQWLDNFSDIQCGNIDEQRLHALYLLTQLMYFGKVEIRHMLKYIFEHLYKYKIIRDIRKANNDTTNVKEIISRFRNELESTRFLGMGNPAESGVHLLYYFRQENNLSSKLFIHTHQIFSRSFNENTKTFSKKVDENVNRYVFIDDFCGTGQQATSYSKDVITELKELNPNCIVCYYILFATSKGKKLIKETLNFDDVECVFELDDTFQCFAKDSRFFIKEDSQISQHRCEQIAKFYGKNLLYGPWGFENAQAMLAFAHNTPDNTLPIFGSVPKSLSQNRWHPVFPRHNKNYGGL
ncbi:MAG: hypothetical protein AB7F40_05050 [Victivallaceae bacterium]